VKYVVNAISTDRMVLQLEVEAPDLEQAARQARMQGLHVTRVKPKGGMAAQWLRRHPKLSLVLFSQELLALLKAGLGIVEALEGLLEKEQNPDLRPVLARLLQGLRDGKRLSQVMAEQSGLFPDLYLGLVRSAEGTSDLPRALERFIDYQQRIDLVRNKVTSAAIYPTILLSVGAAVSLFLLVYVVPRFAEVYQGAGRELPWMSQLMLRWGEFASEHGTGLLLAMAVLGVAVVMRWQRIRETVQTVLIARIPGLGERVRIYWLSRLYLTLGMLLEGGIPLISAMTTAAEVVPEGLRLALEKVRVEIESGAALSDAFQRHGLTTSISLRMLAVGERSGELGTMLNQSAHFYDGEIARWIERFMRSFEPLLMTVIGLVVGFIVILLYMPIFDLAGNF
jgi:general secretion pathway protein F